MTVGSRQLVGSGFTLTAIAASGPESFYGTTSGGSLYEYLFTGDTWTRELLAQSGYSSVRNLASPFGGLVFLARSDGSMDWAEQTSAGLDRHAKDPVDTQGWTQNNLSGVPGTCASSRATLAVDHAFRQLGKPYRWGAAGPDAFDCSGLTQSAWKAAGVTLARVSRDQYAMTQFRVPVSQRQPGDVLAFRDPVNHVAIYVGKGKMIEAPDVGIDVRLRDLRTEGLREHAIRPHR